MNKEIAEETDWGPDPPVAQHPPLSATDLDADRVLPPHDQRLLEDARRGMFDVIVLTYLDRFGRRQEEIALRVLELRDIGVEVDVLFQDVSDFLYLGDPLARGAEGAAAGTPRTPMPMRIASPPERARGP